jgi:hypothetical protein
LASYILGGPQSLLPETGTTVEDSEDVWELEHGALEPEAFGSTIDMDLFEEFISNL